jgi:hypothetical protein
VERLGRRISPMASASGPFTLKTSIPMRLLVLLAGFVVVFAQNFVSRTTGPPAFFLRDINDGICLAGSEFKRCTINSLWFVSGKPGTYQIHKRLTEDEDSDQELCLVKSDCHSTNSTLQVGSCEHCGASKWNILGDSESGKIMQ